MRGGCGNSPIENSIEPEKDKPLMEIMELLKQRTGRFYHITPNVRNLEGPIPNPRGNYLCLT